ncbi:MAG: CotS family spore coat protein [Dorea sp.]|nr:CotS family spore coat protein [Dorea sp.]
MQEYELNVLEQYNIEVSGTRKTRGAVLCDTDRGMMLLKEVKVSERRIPALYELHEYLQEQGYTWTDRLMLTKEGEYLASSEEGKQYLLKFWFQGRECDVKKPAELLTAAGNLARLHVLMRYEPKNAVTPGAHIGEEYLRHNRELKKVRRFMRGISPKGAFETVFLKYYEQMYQWAEMAVRQIESSDYDKIYKESIESGCMTHGEYNYHNILMLPGGQIAVTNFEKFKRDLQVEDFYYFLRKVMEKQGWKVRLGDNIINAYSAVRPLAEEELKYLQNRLCYPEKFWKIADSYYRSNKAWISAKSIEKLDVAIRQTEEKKRFLEEIFAFRP